MKKIILFLIPSFLFCEVSFDSDIENGKPKFSEKKTVDLLISINENLERVNQSLERLIKALGPYAFDMNGNLIED